MKYCYVYWVYVNDHRWWADRIESFPMALYHSSTYFSSFSLPVGIAKDILWYWRSLFHPINYIFGLISQYKYGIVWRRQQLGIKVATKTITTRIRCWHNKMNAERRTEKNFNGIIKKFYTHSSLLISVTTNNTIWFKWLFGFWWFHDFGYLFAHTTRSLFYDFFLISLTL